MAKVICLTGGMASGKSTAARFLRDLGAHVIDADVLGHRAYAPGSPAHAQVVAAFGQEIVARDGSIDRKALGAKVFADPAELEKLTSIVWPAIRALAGEEISKVGAAGSARVIVLEAAVLLEAGWDDLGDEVWAIVVEREIALARAMERDNISRATAERRLEVQLTNDERIARADVVIYNNGTLEEMLSQLRTQWERVSAQ